MSKTLNNIELPVGGDLEELLQRLSPGFSHHRILRQSVDSRGRKKPRWILTVEVFQPGETPESPSFPLKTYPAGEQRPLIVGTGPAGLFAALRLAEQGVPCDLFERGSDCKKRILAINRFWRYNEFNGDDNVCFGEGGAGLYSDGKLITRIKSPHIPYVMNRLVQFGAPPEIEYLSNPHVGSDKIRRLLPKIREHLQNLGCRFFFNRRVEKILWDQNNLRGLSSQDGEVFAGSQVVLATGHSAEGIFHHLREAGVAMEGKSFALGLRVEHPQGWVNQTQWKDLADHPDLGAANYRLTYNEKEAGLGIYSFCMCPGGYVLSSGTSKEGIVSNGMSNYRRNSPFANAALVVTVDHDKVFGKSHVFGGLELRKSLEHQAWRAVQQAGGTKELPAQRLIDFINGTPSPSLPKSSSPSGSLPVRLDQILTPQFAQPLQRALLNFDRKMPGFLHPEAVLYGMETRTSCPIRITRDPNSLESSSHPGLYPCGEGAGFAGGITSAACDGIRVAEAILSQRTPL